MDEQEIEIGRAVTKPRGYPFPGEVRAVFTTKAGAIRYVVEATGEGYAGMLHIFDGSQIAASQADKVCDHAGYSFGKHGRYCPCGELMADFGD